ncbi:response regulator [bacterium]|nr:response regulator [bacterium]
MPELKKAARKILIADADETTRTILKESLEKEDYIVFAAGAGSMAFELANKEKPDLIISDVFMPEMNGFELCQRVRDTSAIPMVPFVFFTSIDDMLTEIRGFRAGANEYLVKRHTKRQDLLLRIENLLSHVDAFEKEKATLRDGFLGKLGDVSVLDILQLLTNTAKTGNLLISDGTLEGNVFFVKGQIFNAQLGNSKGEDAIYDMIYWEDGFFRFSQEDVPRHNMITTPTNKIINKCRRLLGKEAPPAV